MLYLFCLMFTSSEMLPLVAWQPHIKNKYSVTASAKKKLSSYQQEKVFYTLVFIGLVAFSSL